MRGNRRALVAVIALVALASACTTSLGTGTYGSASPPLPGAFIRITNATDAPVRDHRISPNGRFLAFESKSMQYTSDTDFLDTTDIFVYDRQTTTVVRATNAVVNGIPGNDQADGIELSDISDDGSITLWSDQPQLLSHPVESSHYLWSYTGGLEVLSDYCDSGVFDGTGTIWTMCEADPVSGVAFPDGKDHLVRHDAGVWTDVAPFGVFATTLVADVSPNGQWVLIGGTDNLFLNPRNYLYHVPSDTLDSIGLASTISGALQVDLYGLAGVTDAGEVPYARLVIQNVVSAGGLYVHDHPGLTTTQIPGTLPSSTAQMSEDAAWLLTNELPPNEIGGNYIVDGRRYPGQWHLIERADPSNKYKINPGSRSLYEIPRLDGDGSTMSLVTSLDLDGSDANTWDDLFIWENNLP